ncbi:hypothetical protein [Nocardia sp. NPDC051832]|uniref:hypothetical protein n=1 Tax=Nocardia sp. NPDC051832 TaxID=3155673 RepID=UPI003412E102
MGNSETNRAVTQLRNDINDVYKELAELRTIGEKTNAIARRTQVRVRHGHRQLGRQLGAVIATQRQHSELLGTLTTTQQQHSEQLATLTATTNEILELLKNPPVR